VETGYVIARGGMEQCVSIIVVSTAVNKIHILIYATREEREAAICA
jgi:hypothetical protein